MSLLQKVALCTLLSLPALAQTSQLQQMGIKDGIQVVTGIEQDISGQLWIGSTNGLFSYDGQNFRRYAEADGLPEAQIAFVVSNKDALWVATLTTILRKEGERFVKLFPMPTRSLSVIGNGHDTLYFLSPYLNVFHNSKLFTDPTIRPDTLMSVSPQGDLWYGCGTEICQVESKSLLLFETGQLQSPLPVRHFGIKQGLPALPWLSVAADKAGTILASSLSQNSVWRAEAGKSFAKFQTPTSYNNLHVDHQGNVSSLGFNWIGLWSGPLPQIIKIPGTFLLNKALKDSEGTYWMGASSPGLWRWKQSQGVDTMLHEGSPTLPISYQTTRTVEGKLLVSGHFQGVLQLSSDSTHLTSFGAKDGTYVVDADLDGGAIAGYEGAGLVKLGPDGRIKRSIKDQDGKTIRTFKRLRVDREGTAWISTRTAFYRLARGANVANQIEIVKGKVDYRDIEFARNGDMWVASEKGLAQYHDGKWRVFTTKDGLKSDYIRCVAEDKQGNLWIGYRMPIGFAKLTRKGDTWDIRHFDGPAGFGSNTTFFLKVDSRGWVWRGTNDGVHVSKTGSTDPGEWLYLTTEDGLPHNDVVQYSYFEDADGSVWFGTSGGLTRVHPEPLERAFQSKIVLTMADAHLQGTVLSATLHPISFTHREGIHCRYRLSPGANEWIPHSLEKLSIQNIPFGDHKLEVQARRPGTMWSESATFDFSRPVPLWRATPALVSYASVPIALVFLRTLRRRRFQQEKSLFMEVADLPLDAQRLRLQKSSPKLAKRVQLLLSARPVASAEDSSGMLLNGRYRIEQRIAQGGMATIYKARDERLSGRPTAIKILRPDIGGVEWLSRRFEQERQALGRIQNPGVISVIDIGETPQGLAFLALEFVDGPTLRHLLVNGPLNRTCTATYLKQAADALQSAHEVGVTHRDLKPENLMIRAHGQKEERLVIVDFGIAVVRSPGDATLVLSHAAGSLHYMAPEQAQGRITPACDVYALGLIVFEMITGERAIPLGLGSNGDLPGSMRSYLGNQISAEAIEILTSALHFDPAARPTAIGEWGHRLAALLD